MTTCIANDGDWNFTEVSYASGVGAASPSIRQVGQPPSPTSITTDGLDLIAASGHVYPQVDALPAGARYKEPGLFHLNERDGTFCDAAV